MDRLNQRAQVTLFIIIGVVLIGGLVIYFAFREGAVSPDGIPIEFREVYSYYLSCLEDTTAQGISFLGEQGGYIVLPEFEPGSAYAPFSSQLEFLGQGVPYWMYISGNNLLKEQVPTKQGMESELEEYVSSRIQDCDFTEFERAGYDIYVDADSVVRPTINDLDVEVFIENRVTLFKGNISVVVEDHSVELDSKLGKFYGLSRQVYDFEREEAFLEAYALDVMRLYAPVDGSEISCAPKVFVEETIRTDIINGLAANIPAIKLDGDYYDLADESQDYFVTDIGLRIDEQVNFMYVPNWPTRIELYGDTVIEPVGLQEGLSAMGFCYVPYHFVYDISFPVMVQFYDEENFFQFPVSVVISKSQARDSLPSSVGTSLESDMCEYATQEVMITTSDIEGNGVPALISFTCLDAGCSIGETKSLGGEAKLEALLPQCVNGFIIARAEGYAESKYQASTNQVTSAHIVLDKKYSLALDLGTGVDHAVVRFSSDRYSTTAVFPEIAEVELIEGFYNVTVFVYDNSSLVFPAITDQKCVDVPESGIGGFFGSETEKCFDIQIPQTAVDFAVVGGGVSQEYISVDDLRNSNELNINIPLFGLPRDLDELQAHYLRVEDERIFLEFE